MKQIEINAVFALEGTEQYIEGIKVFGEEIMKGGIGENSDKLLELYEKYVKSLEEIKKLENDGYAVKGELLKKEIEIEGLYKELENKQFLYEDSCRQLTENHNNLVEIQKKAQYWEQCCNNLYNSNSWKISRPFRIPGRIREKLQIKNKQKELSEKKKEYIKFSVLMPVYNVEQQWLERAIESIMAQTYENWELCIVDDASTDKYLIEYLTTITNEKIKIKFAKENGGISVATNLAAEMATGEYILLMDNDDEITNDALQEFYQCITEKGAEVIYSDQDSIDINGNHSCPVYKPDWSPDLFRSQMYIGHLCGFKKDLFFEVGGFRKQFDGSQDYDLLLRIIEKTNKIEHIDKVLYSWRTLPTSTAANPNAKPYAQYAGLNAIQEHLDRTIGEGAKVVETEDLFVYDIQYPLKVNTKISIIIPTKDHVEDLKIAIDSIFEKSTYKNFEIIILNNNSEEKKTYDYFKWLVTNWENIRVENAFYEFNWSKLNNHGISVATGDVYIFLNNDVKIVTPDWMERLAAKALRKDVGAVGAMLLYEDETIQHAGVVVGLGGWADHIYKGALPIHNGTPYISPVVTRNVTAVTGACMAIAKKTIEKIGFFNDNFIICGSDVEMCIRANKKGLVNIYDPYVRLVHYESKSRGTFVPEIDFKLSDKFYAPYREKGDPYYNNNLSYQSLIPKLKKDDVEDIQNDVMQVSIPEVTAINFRKVEYERKRLNILLPSLNPEHVFGGIATAYKFFLKLVEKTKYDSRIILVDAVPTKEAIDIYEHEYCYVSAEEECSARKQILPYSDRVGKTMPVSDNDYFIFTGWWTAYCIQTEYQNWKNKELKINPFIYFIQDYEPGFYPWSTKYMLADATYRSEFKQVAIFNSKELKEYFDLWGYDFYQTYVFDPVLNDDLKRALESAGKTFDKKKQILVYGRPNTQRNAFELLVESLRKWVEIQNNVEEWEILSAGELHNKVSLGKGKYLTSVGKLSMEGYIKILQESYAGISLMVSPHPSYPPLEMSVFGVKVITNTYANKNLSLFNDNIISLKETSPYSVACALAKICNEYNGQGQVMKEKNKGYCMDTNVFPFIDDLLEFMFEK